LVPTSKFQADRGSGRGLVTVIGAINWDVSIFEDSFAGLGEEVPIRDVEEYSGGKGANVAVAAARILGRDRAAFIGALGTDEVARRQIRELRKEGVLTDGVVVVKGYVSGRAYILVNREGRKSIHTHFGANALIRPSHLREAGPAKILSRTTLLVVMDTPTDVGLAAAREARGSGAHVIYSPGVRVREGWKVLADVIDCADVVVLDKAELARLSGKRDLVLASEFLQQGSPEVTVITTSGKGGCLVANRGRISRLAGIDLSRLKMKAVNSTGSGDSFLGVLASFMSWGFDADEAAEWANLAGALKATRYETRGSPTRARLQSVMRRWSRLATPPTGSKRAVPDARRQ
jgi:ribokinase